jgi:hypothetical protein
MWHIIEVDYYVYNCSYKYYRGKPKKQNTTLL